MTAIQESETSTSVGSDRRKENGIAGREPKTGSVGAPRIALLTPYSGGNLGDAAIQDALIANIRARIPGTQFSGISLNNENFLRLHGDSAFPLCATNRPFYSMPRSIGARRPVESSESSRDKASAVASGGSLKQSLRNVPFLGPLLAGMVGAAKTFWGESRHTFGAYRFLRHQDILVVSGGGQLDEEWGGPWGHPFSLYKWAALARLARVPFVIVSVGACKLSSKSARFFIAAALRKAKYRSFRDRNSAAIAALLLHDSAVEPVVPDIAFSLLDSELPAISIPASIPGNRRVIAISLIAYAKPGSWPHQDRALYDRYLDQMALVIAQLLSLEYFLIFVRSASSDGGVIPDLMARLDSATRQRIVDQTLIPNISTWQQLLTHLQGADLLIASRLHSVILGFVAGKPSVAISFDPKVDWVMQDLGQAEYLLQIDKFTSAGVITAVDEIQRRSESIVQQINAYKQSVRPSFDSQYNSITNLIPVSRGV